MVKFNRSVLYTTDFELSNAKEYHITVHMVSYTNNYVYDSSPKFDRARYSRSGSLKRSGLELKSTMEYYLSCTQSNIPDHIFMIVARDSVSVRLSGFTYIKFFSDLMMCCGIGFISEEGVCINADCR